MTNSNIENNNSTNYNNKSRDTYMKVNYQGKNYNTGNVKASVTSPRINYSTFNGSIQPNQGYSTYSEKNLNLNGNTNMYSNKTNKDSNFQFQSDKDNSVNFVKQSVPQQSSRKEKESNLNYSSSDTLNDKFVIQNSNKIFLENIPSKQGVSPGNFYISPKNKAYTSQSSHNNNNNFIKTNSFYMQPWGGNMNPNMNMVNPNMNMVNSNINMNPNSNLNTNYFMMPSQTNPYFFDPYNGAKMPVQFDHSNQNRKSTNTIGVTNKSNSNKAYTERNFANKPPQKQINTNTNANQKFNSDTGRGFLTVSIKIKEEEAGRVIYLKRGEDYFKKATEFCKVNKLNDKLVKPIFNSIAQASEAIDKVMLQVTSLIDGRYLESIRKAWEESKEQLEEEESNLNLSCMTCMMNGEPEELFGYESIESTLSSSF